ncbi:MAG: Zn-dependent oligopeptidase [Fimbriimonas ginsengisoli]|uniref:Zn-dependent oligopeptidase n=1 Tax=Fimbriimonas ginsengisoli TaxID=1005039 RepID=A0A931PW46_FIMGI|nr:Zn-dependent oligopeptidase [Fimbriimonas ginsengisoli]
MRTSPRLWALAAPLALLSFACAEVHPKVAEATKRADAAVAAIVAIPDKDRTFENTLGALDDIGTRLDTETSVLIFMQFVSTDANARDTARESDEFLSNWQIELGKREDLYKAVKAYADTSPKLEGEQARYLKFTMRDYRRAGMDLPKDKRDRLKDIEKELNKLGIEFEQNIAEDETRVPLTRAELRGVPKDVIDKQPQTDGVLLVGMDYPTFDGITNHCDVEATRQKVWTAYKRRGGKKNVRVLEKLVKLRAEQAQLLGFATSVDYELEPRMAKTAAAVADFYKKLRPIVRKKSAADFAEFLASKRKQTGNKTAQLYPWDYAYLKDRLLKEKYAVDEEKVREYLPVARVVDGLFKVTQSLYGLEYREITDKAAAMGFTIWHPDAKFYEVVDKEKGGVIGRFFIDLYPRPNKYTHAACWSLWERKVWPDGTVQLPLAAVVANLSKPSGDKPALLTHDEVVTFFHEFGHCLHDMLTQTKMGRFSGTSVERDFVEAPSQMFENWVWNGKVLRTFARHYKTGEPFPDKLLKGMLAAQHLGSGIESEHQFYYGIFDQRIHTVKDGKVDTTKVANDVYAEVELYKPVPEVYFHASFGHMVGYQGAYYGYMWSLVYAQDMFQRFEQLGILDPKAGQYYRSKILSRGGSMDAMDMLKDYLGREPQLDAFLRHLGLESKPAPVKGKG